MRIQLLSLKTTISRSPLYGLCGRVSLLPQTSKPQPTPKQKQAAGSEKRLKIQANLNENQAKNLLDSLTLSFEQPLKKLDTSLIHFSSDSSFKPITNYHIHTDSSQKKLTLQYNWTENTLYNLILEKDFAEDTSGRALLKTDTLKFKTKKLSDYGSFRIRFKNLDRSVNPVILFVQNETVIRSFPLNSADLNQSIFSLR